MHLFEYEVVAAVGDGARGRHAVHDAPELLDGREAGDALQVADPTAHGVAS